MLHSVFAAAILPDVYDVAKGISYIKSVINTKSSAKKILYMSKFIYIFTPKVKYKEPERSRSLQLDGKILRVLFRLSPIFFLAYLCTSLLQLTTPLFFFYTLSNFISDREWNVLGVNAAAALTLLSAAYIFAAIIRLNLDQAYSAKLCEEFQILLTSNLNSRTELPAFERVASRDFSVILDGFGLSIELITIPLFILVSTVAIYLISGKDGLWAMSAVWVFIPIAYLTAKLSDSNYNKVMKITARRIELGYKWLREGPLLKGISQTETMKLLVNNLQGELKARNYDSALRGADSYIIGFGRLSPYLLILIFAGSTDNWNVSLFWLSAPLITAVLCLPRAYLNFKTTTRSLAEVRKTQSADLPSISTQLQKSQFVRFNKEWPIWPSSIRDLLVGSEGKDLELFEIFKVFRLIPELGETLSQALNHQIEIDGRNVSEGQRLRLQIIRGIYIAKCQKAKLELDDELVSLDISLASSIYLWLMTSEHVVLSDRAKKIYEKRCLSSQKQKTLHEVKAHSKEITNRATRPPSLLSVFLFGTFLLTLPAAMMSFSANLTVPENGFSATEILIYTIVGILLGVLSGLLIEGYIRKVFANTFISGMRDVRRSNLSNSMQVISRDLTTCFERIAWYSHDICWLAALLLCNVGALWFGFGWLGLIIFTTYSLLLGVIYRLSIDELYKARVDSVRGFDALIKAVQTAYILSRQLPLEFHALDKWISKTKRTSIQRGLGDFYTTHMRSIITRSVASMACVAVSDIVIISTVWFGQYGSQSDASMVLVMNSLLLIRSGLANVFLAITGFKSQSLSISRLFAFSEPKDKILVSEKSGKYLIPSFTSLSGNRYSSNEISIGEVHSLSGYSGVGKSEYLKAIASVTAVTAVAEEVTAGVSTNADTSFFYLNSEVAELAGEKVVDCDSLIRWIESLPGASKKTVFIDELLNGFSIAEVSSCVEALKSHCINTGDTFVIVDHRYQLEKNIDLPRLLCKE